MAADFEAQIKWIVQIVTGSGHRRWIDRNGAMQADVPIAVSRFDGTGRFALIAETELRLDNAIVRGLH